MVVQSWGGGRVAAPQILRNLPLNSSDYIFYSPVVYLAPAIYL